MGVFPSLGVPPDLTCRTVPVLDGGSPLGIGLFAGRVPGVCPHRRCSTRTPRPHDEGRWRRRSLGGVVRPVSPRVPITICITSVGFDASALCRLSPTLVGHRRELGSGARAGRTPSTRILEGPERAYPTRQRIDVYRPVIAAQAREFRRRPFPAVPAGRSEPGRHQVFGKPTRVVGKKRSQPRKSTESTLRAGRRAASGLPPPEQLASDPSRRIAAGAGCLTSHQGCTAAGGLYWDVRSD